LFYFIGHTQDKTNFLKLIIIMAAAVVAASELPFDRINAVDVIPLLLALLPSDCISGKTFWKSYKKWDSLTTEQRNKSSQFWKQNITAEVRARLTAQANAIVATESAEESIRYYLFSS
jgi:hypothetical protein